MEVKLYNNVKGPAGRIRAGVHDLDNDLAEALIKEGKAEAYKPEAKPKEKAPANKRRRSGGDSGGDAE